jgi:hypothetical protein
MGDLKPLGSEKLTGQDKLKRIMEIARFNEVIPSSINETAKSEYSISLADGNKYEIVRERQGYIIKKTISESVTEYIEPMKNRKYYSSYSQAFKRLNLVAGELNRLNENEEGTSLYGEQKKFVLKTPKPKEDAAPAPMAEVPAVPPAVPAPALPPSPNAEMPMGDDSMDLEMGAEEMGPEGDVEIDAEMDMEAPEMGGEEKVTFKTIQKLTGKLTQKIRTLDNQEGMTSEDVKYVINMVLSSLELKSLSEEDKEDILSKFEEDSEDLGDDDMDGEDLTDDSEVEDIQADMDIPMEGEMDEDDEDDISYSKEKLDKELKKLGITPGSNNNLEASGLFKDRSNFTKMMGSFDDEHGFYDQDDRQYTGDFDFDYDEEEFDDFDSFDSKYGGKQGMFDKGEKGKVFFNKYKEKFGKPFRVRTPRDMGESDYGNGAIIDSIFSESPIDKVISKYFEVSKKEILENKEKKAKKKLQVVSEVRKQMKSIIKLTESVEQELAAQKFLEENISAKIIGKTNKKNLVFENKGKEVKISPEGLLI